MVMVRWASADGEVVVVVRWAAGDGEVGISC